MLICQLSVYLPIIYLYLRLSLSISISIYLYIYVSIPISISISSIYLYLHLYLYSFGSVFVKVFVPFFKSSCFLTVNFKSSSNILDNRCGFADNFSHCFLSSYSLDTVFHKAKFSNLIKFTFFIIYFLGRNSLVLYQKSHHSTKVI